MSARSVTDFIAAQLDGQTFGNFPAIQAAAELPAVGQAGQTPQVWVWPEELEERRQAAPRGVGLKQTHHRITVWVLLTMHPDAGHSFRDLIEGILAFWRLYSPMPVRGLVDAVTGRTSDIVSIGETMRAVYDVPVATKSQRLQAYAATITLDVQEILSG